MPREFRLDVNGIVHTVTVDGGEPLLWVLRDVLGLTGAKFGCGEGACGACSVLVDGEAHRSCILSVGDVAAGVPTLVHDQGLPIHLAVELTEELPLTA